MKILNFTGKPVGLTNELGKPHIVLAPNGNAKCKIENVKTDKTINLTPIYEKKYGRAVGLPDPDFNLEKVYIVDKQVAEAEANTRFDLLVVEEPMEWEGTTYYKKLIKA